MVALGLTHVIIELDALIVVSIHNSSTNVHPCLLPLVDDCRSLLQRIPNLGSTNRAGRVLHWSPMRGAATDAATRALVLRLSWLRFASTWLQLGSDLHRLGSDSRQLDSDLAKIRAYRPTAKTDRNRPKSALNHARTAKIGFE